MALFIKGNQEQLDSLFNLYEAKIAEVLKNKDYRLAMLDVRLRLLIGRRINFNMKYAKAKSPHIRLAYRQLMQLNDAWFVFELLFDSAEKCEWDERGNSRNKKRAFGPLEYKDKEITDIVFEFNQYIQAQLCNKTSRKKDFVSYLKYLADNTFGGTSNAVRAASEKVEDDSYLEYKDMIAIIYAIRNRYVHNGETAKTGVKYYRTKTELLAICYDSFVLCMLKISTLLATYLLEEKAD